LKYLRFFLLSFIGTLFFLLSGCNDAPDSIGGPTQPPEDSGIIHATTFYATGHSTLKNLLYTSSIDRFMAGKYLTYEAKACIKFHTWPDSLLRATITSATLQLHPFYHFGADSTSSVGMEIRLAEKNVQVDSLDFDLLDPSYVGHVMNTVSPFPIIPTDTLCSISLNPTDVTKWFLTNATTIDTNNGMILQCAANANAIMGFYSCNISDTALQPTLYVNYVDTNGVAGTYIHKTGSSRYVGNSNLTLPDNNTMYVQDGVSYRGLITLDSHILDSLSLLWPISIHRAILQITLDSASSSLHFTPFNNNRLYCLSVGSDDKANGAFFALSNQLTNSDGQRVYQFNVEGMMSSWIKNTSIRKIAICGYYESGSFDLFSFYGSGAAIAQRPKLTITYTIKH
jgi:hypothetical protein